MATINFKGKEIVVGRSSRTATELKLYNKGKILTDEGFNLIKNNLELLMAY